MITKELVSNLSMDQFKEAEEAMPAFIWICATGI